MGALTLDEAFDVVGTFGYVQIFVFLYNGLAGGFAITFQMLHMIFIGARPEYDCVSYAAVEDNANLKPALDSDILPASNISDQCYLAGKPCQMFQYTSNFTSIVTEWDLVCGNAYEASLGQSLFMAGVLTGAAVFGPVADIFGRRKTYFFTLIGAMLSSVASAFSTNLYVFVSFRFLSGFHCAGTILASFVLLMEIVGANWRATVCLLAPIFGSIAIAVMSLLAYAIPHWRQLSLVFAIWGIVCLPFFIWIPESPRWLHGRGRVKEAERLFLKFARRNGRKVEEIELVPHIETHKEKSTSLLVLTRNCSLLRVTMIQFYTWLVNCIVYYGSTMGAGDLGGNMYVSVILSGLVEIPANLVVLFLLKFFGRRANCVFFSLLGGIASLSIMAVPENDVYTINALALVCKLSVTATFSIIYLWSSEIFPTVMRNSAMGLMSMGARTGGIISPFINLLATTHPLLPYLVFGSLFISSGLLNLFLPESRNKLFPQTIEDMKKLCGQQTTVDHSINLDEQRVQLLEGEFLVDDSDDDVTEFEVTTPL